MGDYFKIMIMLYYVLLITFGMAYETNAIVCCPHDDMLICPFWAPRCPQTSGRASGFRPTPPFTFRPTFRQTFRPSPPLTFRPSTNKPDYTTETYATTEKPSNAIEITVCLMPSQTEKNYNSKIAVKIITCGYEEKCHPLKESHILG